MFGTISQSLCVSYEPRIGADSVCDCRTDRILGAAGCVKLWVKHWRDRRVYLQVKHFHKYSNCGIHMTNEFCCGHSVSEFSLHAVDLKGFDLKVRLLLFCYCRSLDINMVQFWSWLVTVKSTIKLDVWGREVYSGLTLCFSVSRRWNLWSKLIFEVQDRNTADWPISNEKGAASVEEESNESGWLEHEHTLYLFCYT